MRIESKIFLDPEELLRPDREPDDSHLEEETDGEPPMHVPPQRSSF